MKSILMVRGGWLGHEPVETSDMVAAALRDEEHRVDVFDSLDVYLDREKLSSYDVIVQCWTMGEINTEQAQGLLDAVAQGVGFAGWHGGMSDAFRSHTAYQWMVGGQFVAHPGGILDYEVRLTDRSHPITEGLTDFRIRSEQYYMHVDPSNHVLAETVVLAPDAPWAQGVRMPVVWTRQHGDGKVFHNTLGHTAADFAVPECLALTIRGILWAAR